MEVLVELGGGCLVMSLESPFLAEHVLMEPIQPLHLFQWGWEKSRAAFLVPRYMYEFPTSQMDTQKAGELELSCKYQEITRGQGLKMVKAKQVSPGREPPTGGDDHGQLGVQDGSSGGMIWVCDMHWGDIGT